MLFDQVRELPVATLRRAPRARLGLVVGHLRRWLSLRWHWFRPRTVPVLVAMLGMVAVLQSVSYLSHPSAPAPTPAGFVMIGGGPPGATLQAGGNATRVPAPTSPYQVRLVPVATR
jgi:hypothetical protein